MTLSDDLTMALKRFAAQKEVLICLDFDGCVAELVADADAARPVPVNAEAIDRLAELEGVTLAYVSGRPLETLRQLASPPDGTLLFGSHGAERWLGPGTPGLELTDSEQTARQQVLDAMEAVAADHEGAWVEHKPAGGALHVRHIADKDLGERVLDQTRHALEPIQGAHTKEGKRILEAVVVKSTKGEAITELRELKEPDAVFFAGDDVTDEYGFAVLQPGDVGVKVGEGETAAEFRIPEPSSVAEVLHAIADARPTTA